MMQEVRIEDCTSDSSAEPAPWEDTMRLMPPLLELADMFNIILRRCRNSRADSDLVRGAPLPQLLISCLMSCQRDSHSLCDGAPCSNTGHESATLALQVLYPCMAATNV